MARHLSPFHSLRLSSEDELAVIQQASAVLHQTLALETEYRRQGAKVDTKEWKKVSTIDDFHVYKQRRRARREADAKSLRGTVIEEEEIAPPELFSMREDLSSKHWRISVDDTLENTAASSSSSGDCGDERRVPRILCAGNVEGTLEDFMYGVYDGDDVAWRVRTAYIKDKFADARILATIHAPTEDDPCRFLGIKWFSTEYPPLVGTFIQKRDVLVIEAMGITKDEHGVPYGYYLMHDFHHPSLPSRTDSGVVRLKFNLCFINRQVSSDRIGQYARGHVDPGGSLPSSVSVAIAAISLASTANSVETAYNKKLSWLMTQQQHTRRSTLSSAPTSVCASCKKSSMGLLSRGPTNCHVCGLSHCSKCTVERKLVVDIYAPQVTLRALPFCFGCVLRAKQLVPMDLARVTNMKKQS
ncbi:hypothetical protein Poli38472_012589 [Pythium oligandrum]|uniref:FYVE-type domain-containing protein n=1 Tax=Pythium oligandrum TaxID=41045 RepID=A0A8K1CE85_PYTOL|nr:hypothetical protein Poli38472_012589 [Pythium oligandrum]|eukprot:TMW61398.1 hypothetical protein Poli38472_012589 [Pythium oligandrum]